MNMSKIYVQAAREILSYSGALAAGASTLSGSVICDGYARIRGLAISSASLETASGVRVMLSSDHGINWDHTLAASGLTACSGSAFDYPVHGDAVQVVIKGGATASSASIRTLWYLLPVT